MFNNKNGGKVTWWEFSVLAILTVVTLTIQLLTSARSMPDHRPRFKTIEITRFTRKPATLEYVGWIVSGTEYDELEIEVQFQDSSRVPFESFSTFRDYTHPGGLVSFSYGMEFKTWRSNIRYVQFRLLDKDTELDRYIVVVEPNPG